MSGRKPSLFATVVTVVLTSVATMQTMPMQDSSPATPPTGLTIGVLDGMQQLPGGLSALPSPPIPRDNPQTASKVDLGGMLFHDKRLSGDGTMSCAACHDSKKAYSDGRAKAIGV